MNRYEIALGKKPPAGMVGPFVGWISDTVGNREQLIAMGVTGKIVHNRKEGCYEHCIITEQIGKMIKKKHKDMFLGAFTALGPDGKQLPKEYQLLHKLS